MLCCTYVYTHIAVKCTTGPYTTTICGVLFKNCSITLSADFKKFALGFGPMLYFLLQKIFAKSGIGVWHGFWLMLDFDMTRCDVCCLA